MKSVFRWSLWALAWMVAGPVPAPGPAVSWSAPAGECLPDHAVILMYHHVSAETPASTSVTPEVFASHLRFLEDHGFHVMDLAEVVAALRGGGALPDSAVVLTFDDGYVSVFEEALPRLREREWPFTVFVSPDAIDRGEGPVMDWGQLREITRHGGTVACHGWDHRFVNRRREGESAADHQQRLEAEWLRARERLRAELGSAPDLLAYPYGEYCPEVQVVVEKMGWTACGQQSGAAGPQSDLTCLPRFPMAAAYASLETFGAKVASLPWPSAVSMRVDPMLAPDLEEAPALTLVVEPSCLEAGAVSAFASGQGAIAVEWIDREAGFLRVQAAEPLPPGRSRYNVTAPAPAAGRWYWYSQLWIVGREHDH